MFEKAFWKGLSRRKAFTEIIRPDSKKPTPVNMNKIDVGSTLGIGVFIIVGYLTRDITGPSVIVSLIITSIVGLFTGFYYSELGNRIQRAGSAYTYAYVCIGEWAAFFTGWHLILEYVIGISAISKVIGHHVDCLLDELIRLELTRLFPINCVVLSDYFDFFGFGIAIFFGCVLLAGMKRSEFMIKVLLMITVSVMLFVIIAGAFKGNSLNWNIPPAADVDIENFGFFAFGVSGVFRGCAISMCIFIGLDYVHKTKNRPTTFFGFVWYLIASLFVIATGIIISMLFPYYLLDEYAPFPQGFNEVGWFTAHYIISIGGILTLLASFSGLAFPLERILQSMAKDRLILEILGYKPGKSTVPLAGISVTMILSSLFAGLFTLGQLIEMLSIGTIFTFLMVTISIVLLRYANHTNANGSVSTIDIAETGHSRKESEKDNTPFLKKLFNCGREKKATKSTFFTVKILITFLSITSLAESLIVRFALDHLIRGEIWAITITSILSVLILIWILLIFLQPMRKHNPHCSTMFVPLLPCVSIFFDILFMVWLPPHAWVRFLVWSCLGGLMYWICFQKYRKQEPKVERSMKNNGFKGGIYNIGFIGEPEMTERPMEKEPATPAYEENDPNGNNLESISKQSTVKEGSSKHNQLSLLEAPEPIQKMEAKIIVEAERKMKPKTPSPSTSLDDIVLCSEIESSLTEKKEPNGKTYFIDEGKPDIQEEAKQKSADDIEQNSVIAFLDDVLDSEENHHEEKPTEDFDLALQGSPVVAVIHLSAEQDLDKTNNADAEQKVDIPTPDYDDDYIGPPPEYADKNVGNNDDKSSVSSVGADSFEYIPKSDNDNEKSLDNEPGTDNKEVQTENPTTEEKDENVESSKPEIETLPKIEPENQDKVNTIKISKEKIENTNSQELRLKSSNENSKEETPLSFKDRLTMLLGKQTATELSKRTYRKLNDESSNLIRIPHTKSEPDIMKLVQDDINNKKGTEKNQENQSHANDFGGTSKIPPAPKFDPDVYRTLGSNVTHARKTPIRPVLATAMSIDRAQIRLRETKKLPNETIKQDKIEDFVENDSENRLSKIKNQLENILKRGPPNRYSKPPSKPSSPVPDKIPGEVENEPPENEQIYHFKEAGKPFDTVHKQKILFDDVLKSINSDSRPNLLRPTSPSRFSNSTVF